MEDGEILRYGVKTVKGKRNRPDFAKRVEKALSPLLKAIGTQGLVVVQRGTISSKRGALCRTLDKMLKLWKKKGYRLCLISLLEVKRSLCENRKATYGELIKVVAERYPVLWPLSVIRKPEKTKYWGKAMIAMALVETAKRRLTRG